MHPDLNYFQATSVAKMLELAYDQLVLAENEALSEEDRKFAVRTQEVATRAAATQVTFFEAVPQFESVLKMMRAEKEAGLESVSPKLAPEVRVATATLFAYSMFWGELSQDITEIRADRFIGTSDSTDPIDKLDTAKRAVCTLESSVTAMNGTVDLFHASAVFSFSNHMKY